MSRDRSCKECGSEKDVISTGLCAECEDLAAAKEARSKALEEEAFDWFMEQPSRDKWRQVWDVLRQAGYLG